MAKAHIETSTHDATAITWVVGTGQPTIAFVLSPLASEVAR